jgi:hypothetical protein
MDQFYITLCNPTDFQDEYRLKFHLYDNPTAEKWKRLVLLAQQRYGIDDPERFYGLNSELQERQRALADINHCISVINQYQPIIHRTLSDVSDTDTLNYLHHIFEEYHGLLDQQNTEYWNNATDGCRRALRDLNIAVHRVENFLYGNKARFTVTYFGLPKTQKLIYTDFLQMTNQFIFGGLYLNYVEVGKTLEDMLRDDDQYIDADAFKPWDFYSADFTVKLFDSDVIKSLDWQKQCHKYFLNNREFFKNMGYPEYSRKLFPGAIKIGQMEYTDKDQALENIRQRQYVKSVHFD